MSTRRRRPFTVRTRILATVLVLSALALVAAGGTAWGLQRIRVDRNIDDALNRTITELRTLAATGVDPDTGSAFQDSDRLLYMMMSREVPATNEGMIAFVRDNVRYQTQDIGVPLALDPELVHAVSDAWESEQSVIATLRTSQREYRYAAVPVRVGDSTPGAIVLAFDRSAEQAEIGGIFRTYGLVAAVSLLILAVVAWILSGRLLRPLRTLRETAEQISDTDLSRRIPVDGDDDLSDLARTFNDMLGRLETAFGSQRQLLDDAGHELRTPITIVRGHLELMDPSDEQDATETRALALRELDRMHRLADDLVLLARSEAPDFVRAEQTDVGTLLDNVLDQARQLGNRRWRVTNRAEAVVDVDPERVTQALLQLAANAVKFSDDGSTVRLGSSLEDGLLALWVEDEGIGIPPEQQGRIFERFAQLTGPQRRPAGGSGLGLSIVAAIAAGHEGRVDVTSAPGRGSRFTLLLPAPGVQPAPIPDDEIVVDPDELGAEGADQDGAR
ncbi:ATP-binding protein [Georgenia satyanarayanai]|uniref:sensor histidine kinase n=1 Tax=Georgenia satyanarayanai TaxID=860221 RepID=UPI0020424957|nr:sensor histidine kinase [Georgenia satyanarayanai]MCM3660855.1 ATP-binding protein [Georgenia satyanarayanai]